MLHRQGVEWVARSAIEDATDDGVVRLEMGFPVVVGQRDRLRARGVSIFSPTGEFGRRSSSQRDTYRRRRDWTESETAIAKLLERDSLITDAIAKQAAHKKLRVHRVDGSLSVAETVSVVREHFGL